MIRRSQLASAGTLLCLHNRCVSGILAAMQLQNLLEILRTLAPEHLAEPWDKVGLQLGDPKQPVQKAMLCIDLTDPVLAEAIADGVDLVVAYHPPIFAPLEALTSLETKQRIILAAARAGLAIYTPHTALDAAAGGVNDWLAEGIGQGAVRPIRPAVSAAETQYKLVVFVPAQSTDKLRSKLTDAGAGRIGGYEQCSFTVVGEGTFQGGPQSNPVVGLAGSFERVEESRLEMICPGRCLAAVVAALRETHPYEEPAFDLYRLEQLPEDSGKGHLRGHLRGQGRIVALDRAVALSTLLARIKQHLGVRHLEVSIPQRRSATRRPIKRVGVCAGAGGSLLEQAGEVDAFLTGEMRHHDVLAANAAGRTVILAGHTQTERPYLKTYRRHIIKAGGQEVQWRISRADRPPSSLR
jgi:dinuclear metal center YbgI/SA1388 family protein